MTNDISPEELAHVLSLDSNERYGHFVSSVCELGELWFLEDAEEDILILQADDNIGYIPVWHHPQYAAEFAKQAYSDYSPLKVSLSHFMNAWLNILNEDGIRIGILPNLEANVWMMEPLDLKTELIEILSE